MSDSIFRHEDRDGDELDVYRGDAGGLTFHATEHVSHLLTSVHLNPEAVLQLRDALTEWIGDRSATYPVPNYVTRSDVHAIVSQMLAQVLPLHQTPQAAVPAPLCTDPFCEKFPGASEHFEHDPEPACRCHDADGYSTRPVDPEPFIERHSMLCMRLTGESSLCTCGGVTNPIDPEPHDVGHPEPAFRALADARIPGLLHAADSHPEPEPLCHRTRPADAHPASRCTFCGWLWEQHSPAAAAPRQLVGCECGHRWGVHGGGMCHVAGCTCTRRTQADINNGVQP